MVEHQNETRIPAGEVGQHPQTAWVGVERLSEVRNIVYHSTLAQKLLDLRKLEFIEVVNLEEVVERLLVGTSFVEEGGRAADQPSSCRRSLTLRVDVRCPVHR